MGSTHFGPIVKNSDSIDISNSDSSESSNIDSSDSSSTIDSSNRVTYFRKIQLCTSTTNEMFSGQRFAVLAMFNRNRPGVAGAVL